MKKKIKLYAVFLFILITGCVTNPQYTQHDEKNLSNVINLTNDISLPAPVNEPYIVSLPDQKAHDIEEPSESDTIETVVETEKKPMIALTFDDGPSVHTRSVLNILEKYGVVATFFVLGENVEVWQDTIKQAVKNGNEVASHTWSHIPLTGLNYQAIEKSVKDTNAAIEKVTGIPCPLFYRPPYGLVNRRIANISDEIGYSIVGWTVDPQEWKHFNKNLIYDHVMEYAEENSIILLHDLHPIMPSAVDLIIPALIAKGYHLVTISELLHHVYGELKPGIMYGNPGILR